MTAPPGRGSPRLTGMTAAPRSRAAGSGRQEPTSLVVLVRLLAVGVVAVAVHEVPVGGLPVALSFLPTPNSARSRSGPSRRCCT